MVYPGLHLLLQLHAWRKAPSPANDSSGLFVRPSSHPIISHGLAPLPEEHFVPSALLKCPAGPPPSLSAGDLTSYDSEKVGRAPSSTFAHLLHPCPCTLPSVLSLWRTCLCSRTVNCITWPPPHPRRAGQGCRGGSRTEASRTGYPSLAGGSCRRSASSFLAHISL